MARPYDARNVLCLLHRNLGYDVLFKLDGMGVPSVPAFGIALVLALGLATAVTVLVLTLVAIGGCIFRIPDTLAGLPTALFLIGGFAVFFVAATAWAARRVAPANGAAWCRATCP